MNKPTILPLTKDVVRIKEFLDVQIEICVQKLSVEYDYSAWRNLLELVVCSLVVFNKWRGGETSKMLVSAFCNRPDWKSSGMDEIVTTVTPLELQLLNRFLLLSYCL
jgi:hypothetical protein